MRVFGIVDRSLAVVGGWCPRRSIRPAPRSACVVRGSNRHDGELPTALVENKGWVRELRGRYQGALRPGPVCDDRNGHRKLAWLGQVIDLGFRRQCFARCHGLISAANFVRRDTLLWSSFARPLITVLVGTTLPLII
jgi:hypothetical protein